MGDENSKVSERLNVRRRRKLANHIAKNAPPPTATPTSADNTADQISKPSAKKKAIIPKKVYWALWSLLLFFVMLIIALRST